MCCHNRTIEHNRIINTDHVDLDLDYVKRKVILHLDLVI